MFPRAVPSMPSASTRTPSSRTCSTCCASPRSAAARPSSRCRSTSPGSGAREGLDVDRWDIDVEALEQDPEFPGMEVPRSAAVGVTATLAGDGSGPTLMLNGHTDVVPPGDRACLVRRPVRAALGDGRRPGAHRRARCVRHEGRRRGDVVRGSRREDVRNPAARQRHPGRGVRRGGRRPRHVRAAAPRRDRRHVRRAGADVDGPHPRERRRADLPAHRPRPGHPCRPPHRGRQRHREVLPGPPGAAGARATPQRRRSTS